jgi:hypothetical protein
MARPDDVYIEVEHGEVQQLRPGVGDVRNAGDMVWDEVEAFGMVPKLFFKRRVTWGSHSFICTDDQQTLRETAAKPGRPFERVARRGRRRPPAGFDNR